MTEEKFKITNHNPNIVIKGVGFEDISENIKKIKQLKQQLKKLENEKKSLWLKRDDYNNTVREHQSKARELRKDRDLLNVEVVTLSNSRKKIETSKEDLIAKKRVLGMKIDEKEDHDEKQRLYNELVSVREKLDEVFEQSKEIREEFFEKRRESTEAHQNMLVFRKLEQQSRREADKYHKQGKELGKDIKKLKRELYLLRKKK